MEKNNLEVLAKSIATLLQEYDCEQEVAMYYSNKRFSHFGNEWKEDEGFKGSDIIEYANDKTITMTFEGSFYEVINYGLFPSLLEKFSKLLKDYDLYYELGNAWNLALYKI